MINWTQEVKEYKAEYEDDDSISEWVESLVPIYYGDITNAFNDFSEEITADDVGVCIWQVMTRHIFNAYYEAFMNEWVPFDEEE